jgi:hypothetical protein
VIASDPAVHPFLTRLLDGNTVLNIDATSAIFGGSTHLSLDGDLMELLASLTGAIVVLIAGSIWRRRALRAEHSGSPPGIRAVQRAGE